MPIEFCHPTKPPKNKTSRAYGRLYAWVRGEISKRGTISARDLVPTIDMARAAYTLAGMYRRGELDRVRRGSAGNPNWPGVGRSAVYRIKQPHAD